MTETRFVKSEEKNKKKLKGKEKQRQKVIRKSENIKRKKNLLDKVTHHQEGGSIDPKSDTHAAKN
jgi:hypothetical protein